MLSWPSQYTVTLFLKNNRTDHTGIPKNMIQKSFVVATSELSSFITSLASPTSWAVITQVFNAYYITTHYHLLQQNLKNYI
jgi:hypothetical protein